MVEIDVNKVLGFEEVFHSKEVRTSIYKPVKSFKLLGKKRERIVVFISTVIGY